MLFYLSPSNDPSYNLALEEFLLLHSEEEILLCYINQPSVILGRFQVPFREVDVSFLHHHQIKVARRLSGGGTVYHDLGNLNYSYIGNCQDHVDSYYDLYNQKTLDVLDGLGLKNLSFQRNNIFCENKKISGVAQYKRGKRMVHHGTLLVNADLAQLRALFTKKDYYQTKGVASVSSSVSNIEEFSTVSMAEVLSAFESSCKGRCTIILDKDKIEEKSTYYASKEWIYGKSPKYILSQEHVQLAVEGGRIISVREKQYAAIVGCWHCYDDVHEYVGSDISLF